MLEKFHTILHNISSCLVASASFASVTRYVCPTNRDIYTVFATRALALLVSYSVHETTAYRPQIPLFIKTFHRLTLCHQR